MESSNFNTSSCFSFGCTCGKDPNREEYYNDVYKMKNKEEKIKKRRRNRSGTRITGKLRVLDISKSKID